MGPASAPFFETIEFRICDVPMRPTETVAIAALVQAICVKLLSCGSATSAFGLTAMRSSSEQVARDALGIDGS